MMTDSTQTPIPAQTSPAAASPATGGQSQNNQSNAPGQTTGVTEPSSAEPDSGRVAPVNGAESDSGKENGKAQADTKPDSGTSQDGGHTSDSQEPTDQKDQEGADKEDGDKAQEIEYEPFSFPEGIEMDTEAMEIAMPVFKKLGASQEDAQALVNVGSEMISKVIKGLTEQHNRTIEGWRKETESLFGSDGEAKFKERVGRAEEIVKTFFQGDDLKVISDYGLGNHPAFFKMCLAIAEATTEDRQTFSTSSGYVKGKETLGEIWYPKET